MNSEAGGNIIESVGPQTNLASRRKCILCDASRTTERELMFYQFPSDPDIRKKWVEFCVLGGVMYPGDTINSRILLCSNHFCPSEFGKKKCRLKKSAVPTIVKPSLVPQSPASPLPPQSPPPTLPSLPPATNDECDQELRGTKRLATFSPSDMEDPGKAKAMWELSMSALQKARRQIKSLQRTCQRRKQKIQCLESLLSLSSLNRKKTVI